MPTNKTIRDRIQDLKADFDRLKSDKKELLKMVDEAELSESVYNSNAIENNTLSLQETEHILLQMEVTRNVSVREIFEAKNLARVMEYIREKGRTLRLDIETILLLHKMLLGNISDDIAGRFRQGKEYVRVGSHIAAPPDRIPTMMEELIVSYTSDHSTYFVDKLARFHLEFERIHPFNDGNGRIGRVLLNEQLLRIGFPPVIIRDKEKNDYYNSFVEYNTSKQKRAKGMERMVALALLESLHKRLAYLQGDTIITLADYSRDYSSSSLSALINAANRQSIPAFRQQGVWRVSVQQCSSVSV